MKQKLIRITTVPLSLHKLLEGQLAYMNRYFDVIAVSSDVENLKKVGAKEGVTTYNVEMTRKITPFQDLIAVWKLYILCKKENPKIIHTHTPKAGITGMLAAKLARVPHRLHTVAGLPLLEATGMKRRLLNLVERLTYACATKVYPNSFGLQKIIEIENFTSITKLKVIANGSSNGIDTSYFDENVITQNDQNHLKKELAFSKDDFVFIFVGRIVGDKGINELVEAFVKLSKIKSGVKLLLVGTIEEELDPLTAHTIKQIKENKHIKTVGYQDDVRPYFSISDVLVFPSYREGFPNVVMQAGSMGLPSIVSNINGCNEIIEHNKNGLIIPVKNEGAVLEAMQYCIEEPSACNAMKDRARMIIMEQYERVVVWKAMLAEYKKLD